VVDAHGRRAGASTVVACVAEAEAS
jgi:hypothetical protein